MDQRYAELRQQYEAGQMGEEEFDEQRRRLMLGLQDEEGRYWAKSRATGEWMYHDGKQWRPGTPPGYEPPVSPEGSSEQTQQENGTERSGSRVALWIGSGVVVMVVVGFVLILALVGGGDGPEPPKKPPPETKGGETTQSKTKETTTKPKSKPKEETILVQKSKPK